MCGVPRIAPDLQGGSMLAALAAGGKLCDRIDTPDPHL